MHKKTPKNTKEILIYEGALEIQYTHDERQNSYFYNLIQKITICLMQGINFVTIKAL